MSAKLANVPQVEVKENKQIHSHEQSWNEKQNENKNKKVEQHHSTEDATSTIDGASTVGVSNEMKTIVSNKNNYQHVGRIETIELQSTGKASGEMKIEK